MNSNVNHDQFEDRLEAGAAPLKAMMGAVAGGPLLAMGGPAVMAGAGMKALGADKVVGAGEGVGSLAALAL